MRLQEMSQWVARWNHAALHAGIPGQGACDAWHLTAVDVEETRSDGLHVTGGSLDIYKCFDQLNRHLVLKIAALLTVLYEHPYGTAGS